MIFSIVSFLCMVAVTTFVVLTCYSSKNPYFAAPFQAKAEVREDIKISEVDNTPPATPIEMPTPENPGATAG